MVGVGFDAITTLDKLQLRFRNNLVESECSSSEDLAGIAMATKSLDRSSIHDRKMDEFIPENVLLLVRLQLNRPGCLATMTFSVVGSHFDGIGLRRIDRVDK